EVDEEAVRRDGPLDGLPVDREADAVLAHLVRSAERTFSAVSGSERTRAPTASSMALAMAPPTAGFVSSPTDFAPNGPPPLSSVMSTTRTGGTSAIVGSL